MNHIVLKSAHLPKSKITLGGSPTAAINDIIASLTALAPAGIEVTREIRTSKHRPWCNTAKTTIETDLISRVQELVVIKANLSARAEYAAWTAARVDAFAKGADQNDHYLASGKDTDANSYAGFGVGQTILTFSIEYKPTDAAQRGEGYELRAHAEMAPLAALAEARATWVNAQVTISNTKFRRAGYGYSFAPMHCSTVVKNALAELDSNIGRLIYRADAAAKRAAEISPDLLAAEAARAERIRIRQERLAAALAKANAGDQYAYWPTMKFDSSELKIRDAHLSTTDIEAIAEIIVAAKARHAAKVAQKAA